MFCRDYGKYFMLNVLYYHPKMLRIYTNGMSIRAISRALNPLGTIFSWIKMLTFVVK
jgi:hypothetical protein